MRRSCGITLAQRLEGAERMPGHALVLVLVDHLVDVAEPDLKEHVGNLDVIRVALEKRLVGGGRLDVLFVEEMGLGDLQLGEDVELRRVVAVADLFPGSDGILVESLLEERFPLLEVDAGLLGRRYHGFRGAGGDAATGWQGRWGERRWRMSSLGDELRFRMIELDNDKLRQMSMWISTVVEGEAESADFM